MKHLKLFESAAPRRYTGPEIAISKKITEYCEEYVTDILDECRSKDIPTSSYTRPSGKYFQWILTIGVYYPFKIENLINKLSHEFEVKDWWIQSSGTSRTTSETPNKTQLTLLLSPKFDVNDIILLNKL